MGVHIPARKGPILKVSFPLKRMQSIILLFFGGGVNGELIELCKNGRIDLNEYTSYDVYI